MTDDTAPPPVDAPGRHRLTRGLLGAAAVIAVITIVARVFGFARVVVFARGVGPSTCLGDAYFTANTVPNIVFEVAAGGALASLVVPVLAGAAERGDNRAAGRVTSALLTWTLLVLTPLAVIGIWLADPVMSVLVGDSGRCDGSDAVTAGTRMLLVFLPQIPLYGLGIVMAGVLQAHRRFIGPALAPLLSSLVVITTYLYFAQRFDGDPDALASVPTSDEMVLAVGTTLGVAALSLGLLVPLFRLHLPLRPTLRFPMRVAPRVRALAIAGVVTLAAQQLSVAVVLRLANESGSGGAVTLYNLAWSVFLVPWAVLAVPIATSAFPRLSARAEARDEPAYAATAATSTRAVVLVTLAAAGILIAVAHPLATVLAHNAPNATADDVDALATAMAAFAPGLVGYGLLTLLGRVLYARHAARAAATAIAIGWIAVIGADVALVALVDRSDTVAALGAGNSIGMFVAAVLLAVAVVRTTSGRTLSGLGRGVLTATIGAAVGAVLGRLVVSTVDSTDIATNVGIGLAAAAVALAAFTAVVLSTDRESLRTLVRRADA